MNIQDQADHKTGADWLSASPLQEDLLADYCRNNPGLGLRDVFKYCYQSFFGCEHLASEQTVALRRIEAELPEAADDLLPEVEMLDGDYCRLHLKIIPETLSAQTLCSLFLCSAHPRRDAFGRLYDALQRLPRLAKDGKLPFTQEATAQAVADWLNEGLPPVHHSEDFRRKYHPAYRVVRKEYAALLPLLSRLEQAMRGKDFVTIAIEGRSAAGKTTLADLLAQIFDANLFHLDDFFLPPEKKTASRLSRPGENVDHERFLEEVLLPLSRRESVAYRRYCCRSGQTEAALTVPPKKINLIEGAYSMHPSLRGYYDFTVFLDVDSETQRRRILHRNTPAQAERFFREWIPLEEAYFAAFPIREMADLVWREADVIE